MEPERQKQIIWMKIAGCWPLFRTGARSIIIYAASAKDAPAGLTNKLHGSSRDKPRERARSREAKASDLQQNARAGEQSRNLIAELRGFGTLIARALMLRSARTSPAERYPGQIQPNRRERAGVAGRSAPECGFARADKRARAPFPG